MKKPINYSAWFVDPMYGESSIDCSYICSNGKWNYRGINNGTCPDLDICTVCTIPNEPVFTLKGNCPDSNADFNYYLKLNEDGQIIAYDGYKRGGINKPQEQVWTNAGAGFDITLPMGNQKIYPVGRLIWQIQDRKCNVDGENHLTLSKCDFGKEYTCDSGHCIDVHKRCNKIQDCLDHSDEKDLLRNLS